MHLVRLWSVRHEQVWRRFFALLWGLLSVWGFKFCFDLFFFLSLLLLLCSLETSSKLSQPQQLYCKALHLPTSSNVLLNTFSYFQDKSMCSLKRLRINLSMARKESYQHKNLRRGLEFSMDQICFSRVPTE